MGIAYATGQVSKRGLYWVQLLAAPLPTKNGIRLSDFAG
jgi:hypothetical protein